MKMEAQKLTELLRATIDPNPEQRKAAEDQLAQVNASLTTSLIARIEILPSFMVAVLPKQDKNHVLFNCSLLTSLPTYLICICRCVYHSCAGVCQYQK